MDKIYVMLRDKGTIFSDSSQDVAVTGTEPHAVKYTKKIQDAIRNGRLIQIDEDEAKKLLANSSKQRSEIEKAHATVDNAAVKKAKAELLVERGKVNDLEAGNLVLVDRVAELEALVPAEGVDNPLKEELDALQAKWDKTQIYIKGLQTQVKNLKEGKLAVDVPDPNAEENEATK